VLVWVWQSDKTALSVADVVTVSWKLPMKSGGGRIVTLPRFQLLTSTLVAPGAELWPWPSLRIAPAGMPYTTVDSVSEPSLSVNVGTMLICWAVFSSVLAMVKRCACTPSAPPSVQAMIKPFGPNAVTVGLI